MPKELEKNLRKQAKKKGFDKDREDKYVYGGMRKAGWSPGNDSDKPTPKKKRKRY